MVKESTVKRMKGLRTFYDVVIEEGQEAKRTIRNGHEFQPRSNAHGKQLEDRGLAVWIGGAPVTDEGPEAGGHTGPAPIGAGGTLAGQSGGAKPVAPLRSAGGRTGAAPVASSSSRPAPQPAKPTSAKSKTAKASK